jgi:cell division protein ZapA
MNQLDVTIMGQIYKLACKESEQEALRQAAAYLDEKMCGIQQSAKIKGVDKIAIMAALSIAVELLATHASDGPFSELAMADIKKQMRAMNGVLNEALTPQENLF